MFLKGLPLSSPSQPHPPGVEPREPAPIIHSRSLGMDHSDGGDQGGH